MKCSGKFYGMQVGMTQQSGNFEQQQQLSTTKCTVKVKWGIFIEKLTVFFYSLRRSLIFLYKLLHFRYDSCSQSRRNFGERVLGIFLTKIMATTLDFNGSRTLGRERNLYQGGGRRSKIRRGVGVGKRR